jgi:wobble nucleotide-excising tRNase
METDFHEKLNDLLNATQTHMTRFNIIASTNKNTFNNLASILTTYNENKEIVISYNKAADMVKDLLDNITDIIHDCLAKDELLIELLEQTKK